MNIKNILEQIESEKESHINIRDNYNTDLEMHMYHDGVVDGLIKAKNIISENNKFHVGDFVIWDGDTRPQVYVLMNKPKKDQFVTHDYDIVKEDQLNTARHATSEEILEFLRNVGGGLF